MSTLTREDIEFEVELLFANAEKLGIEMTEWKTVAGDDLDNEDAIEITLASNDDHMALQEINYRGPYEFGCNWDWADMADGTTRLAIPYRDLPELSRCMEIECAASLDRRWIAFLAAYASWGMALMTAVTGHFRLAAGFALAPVLVAAAVVLANGLRAVLGRPPSRDLKSGDRGAPGLSGHVAAVEVGE